MMPAYDEIYLSKAQIALAQMVRYAVNDLQYGIDRFFELFLQSGIAADFAAGDYRYTVGMSGIEMAMDVIFKATGAMCETEPSYSLEKSPTYWCGWVLAFYQWYSAHTFEDIFHYVKPSEILEMYIPYHEMDVMHFTDEMDRKVPAVNRMTNLARLRKNTGLSQRMLAYASGISVRMIQNYEQRKKDINKAQAETVCKIAAVLGCDMREVLEFPGPRAISLPNQVEFWTACPDRV